MLRGHRRGEPPVPSRQLIAIGASLGGLQALRAILSRLPSGFAAPIVLAQHRHADQKVGLAGLLSGFGPLPVREAEDKSLLEPGCVSLAPADYHLLVERDHVALSTDGRVSYARPSVDVLFESAADAFGAGLIAIVLTGANRDGAAGARAVRAAGGRVVVQEPAEAESPVMPRAALAAVPDATVLPADRIAEFLVSVVAPPARLRRGTR